MILFVKANMLEDQAVKIDIFHTIIAPSFNSFLLLLFQAKTILIPHLEIRACDWSKSRHVTFTKSRYFPHEAILPPFVYVNSASTDQYCLHVQFDYSKQQLEPLD